MNKSWNIYMLGTLAKSDEFYGSGWKDSVFINAHNSLQFTIKLISDQPEDFPNNRYFTVYTSDIQDCDFEDDIMLSNEERISKLKDFLSKRLLIFKPVQKGENFIVRNVKQVAKPKDYKDNSMYIPLPLFTANNICRRFEEFLNLLNNKEFLEPIEGISNEEADTPSIIGWKNNDEIKIIGIFKRHRYSRGKLQFDFDYLKYTNLEEKFYFNIIESPEIKELLFVSTDIYSNMEQSIEDGVLIKEKNEEDKTLIEGNKEEKIFIHNFIKRSIEAGLIYDEKDLINFHTSMKSSNLVILSGMSGTGKSKLVQIYGEALGLDSSQLNIIPVRPSWSDDRDLLGYVDCLHNVYKPGDTTLIDTLVQADKNLDKIYIVCFDEMNLARVEYYFSQFLSILENDGINRRIKLYNTDLENRLYNADKYPSEVLIRNNILFVGTVNIDESTYHFSDKVLDRANIINLNMQDFTKMKNIKLEKKTKYSEIMFNEYVQYRTAQSDIMLKDRELELLNVLNKEINKINKNIGIGFRIVKQIDLYLKNIPNNNILSREEGLDLQLLQRILTKIRGSQEQMQELIGIYQKESDTVENSIIIDLLEQYKDLSKFYRVRESIKQKAKELKIYGYTI